MGEEPKKWGLSNLMDDRVRNVELISAETAPYKKPDMACLLP
jgi:hypothetical protein